LTKTAWDLFGTDKKLETAGIRIEYGSFYVVIARAGGDNTKFNELMRDKLRPYARAIELGEMDEDVATRLTGDAFAEAIVQTWGSIVDGDDVPGKFPRPDGSALDFSVDNVKLVFKELPEFLTDLMQQASKCANFRKLDARADAKN
jgi:hypothetical protein